MALAPWETWQPRLGWLGGKVMRNTALMRWLGTLGGDTCSGAGKKAALMAWRGKGLACGDTGMTRRSRRH